jgi:hypothetical protein
MPWPELKSRGAVIFFSDLDVGSYKINAAATGIAHVVA